MAMYSTSSLGNFSASAGMHKRYIHPVKMYMVAHKKVDHFILLPTIHIY